MAREDLVWSAYEAWDRGDETALLALADPDIRISPLVLGATSVGPWRGHSGVRRLLEDVRDKWAHFGIRCDEVTAYGDCFVALVHVEVAVGEGAPVITGDIAHLLEVRGKLFTRFIAFRDRAEAVAYATG